MFDLHQALSWLSAGRLEGDGATVVQRVSTDTRSLAAGDLFVAIRGERFDANLMAPKAEAAGAAAVLIEQRVVGQSGPALIVPNTRVALGELARGWRTQFELPVIAVTGSNGKTTVKEMIAAILAQAFGADHCLSTAGNLNNEIGVPMTVLNLSRTHDAAVIELGMNRPGEIAWLTQIARPTVAMVNNAQREHQEFMASIEATAYENGAVLVGLPEDGIAVYPGDDEFTPVWRKLAAGRRSIEFGLQDQVVTTVGASSPAPRYGVWAATDASPEQMTIHIAGHALPISLAIHGRHNVRNALAAAACCAAIGVEAACIIAGLQAFRPVKGRLVRSMLSSGATLIDDSYNANPDSVRAAIDVLAGLPKSLPGATLPALATQTLLVLGDMGEVGDHGPAFHAEVGAYARERGVTRVLALGDATLHTVRAFGDGAEHFEAVESLIARARALLSPEVTVLIKGSRFMRMERVVAALQGSPASNSAGNATSAKAH